MARGTFRFDSTRSARGRFYFAALRRLQCGRFNAGYADHGACRGCAHGYGERLRSSGLADQSGKSRREGARCLKHQAQRSCGLLRQRRQARHNSRTRGPNRPHHWRSGECEDRLGPRKRQRFSCIAHEAIEAAATVRDERFGCLEDYFPGVRVAGIGNRDPRLQQLPLTIPNREEGLRLSAPVTTARNIKRAYQSARLSATIETIMHSLQGAKRDETPCRAYEAYLISGLRCFLLAMFARLPAGGAHRSRHWVFSTTISIERKRTWAHRVCTLLALANLYNQGLLETERREVSVLIDEAKSIKKAVRGRSLICAI